MKKTARIFTVLFAAATVLTLTGCALDDDMYDHDGWKRGHHHDRGERGDHDGRGDHGDHDHDDHHDGGGRRGH